MGNMASVEMKRCAGLVALAALGALGGELTVVPGGLTPHEALAKVRAAKAAGDKSAWTIRVKDGIYPLKETLVVTPADSGTREAPVTWIGEGEKTVFAGGSDLKAEYFNVTQPRCEVADAQERVPPEKYVIEKVTLTNEAAKALAAIPADELQYAQMLVVHKWSFARRILRGVDPATMTVETHGRIPWTRWQVWNTRETLVSFENVRSAFDAPGEWFYDAKAGAVLYRPLPGEDMASAEVVAPSSKISRLVEFRGDPDKGAYVHDIVFKGIAFAYTDGTSADGGRGPTQAYQHQAACGYDGAVTAEGVRRIAFDGCTFAHTGNYGMRFNDGCVSNTVTNCRLFDLGAGGVWMGAGTGHVANGEKLTRRIIKNLAPRSTAFNRIENCVIRNGGLFNPEGTGVAYTHVSDSKVLRCDIYDFYYTGVSVGWTWGFSGSVAQRNEIAYNRIYDLGKGIMSDMGGVYTLGTSYGTRVHHNVIHDVWAYSYGGWALYTDEGSEGLAMDHNLCWNTTDGGFHQHYGAGCVIRNNIFAWNRKLGAVRMARQVVQDIPCTLNFVNNIVVVREGPLVGRGPRGVGGIWACNLWYDFSGKTPELDGLDWEKWRTCGKETGGVYADPLFEKADAQERVPPVANDFRLKPNSPAIALGFETWDYSVSGTAGGSCR